MGNKHFYDTLRKKLSRELPPEHVAEVLSRFYIQIGGASALVNQSTISAVIYKKINLIRSDGSYIKSSDITIDIYIEDDNDYIIIIKIFGEALLFYLETQ